VGGVA
jgi:putative transposase